MPVREWRFIDKSAWGPGPWLDEPDKVQWVDERTGLDCLVVRNQFGALCGYVGVPADHPAHGVDYDAVRIPAGAADRWPDVHGGLTFADHCAPEGSSNVEALRETGATLLPGADASEFRICHVPEPGRPDDVWWFGFDCAHAWDVVPGMDAFRRRVMPRGLDDGNLDALVSHLGRQQVYWTVDAVKRECRGLAKQLARVASRRRPTPAPSTRTRAAARPASSPADHGSAGADPAS